MVYEQEFCSQRMGDSTPCKGTMGCEKESTRCVRGNVLGDKARMLCEPGSLEALSGLALSLNGCVTLSKSLSLPGLSFLIWEMGK